MKTRYLSMPSLAATLLLLCATLPVRADDGHGHDEKAPAAGAAAPSPRFALSGEHYELVGVLEEGKGRHLRLYLDHADSNAPVRGAQLSLQLGQTPVKVEPGHAEGEYEAELAAALPHGDIAVLAQVSTAQASERLSGELELHEPAADEAAHAAGLDWRHGTVWAGGVLLALAAGALALRQRKLGGRA